MNTKVNWITMGRDGIQTQHRDVSCIIRAVVVGSKGAEKPNYTVKVFSSLLPVNLEVKFVCMDEETAVKKAEEAIVNMQKDIDENTPDVTPYVNRLRNYAIKKDEEDDV